MNPQKVRREQVVELEDLPNIGKAMATDLRCIGIRTPGQLVGRDPFRMYEALCARTGAHHDPCVLDVFISIVHFMDGGDALPWWSFTEERKRKLDSPT
ncbi:MAG TPA: helix-hairpin-helix domain-containing protein [Gallionella sp.]|nr:helix-hairpin-helix domain-containing protein [Gallionella sp.]